MKCVAYLGPALFKQRRWCSGTFQPIDDRIASFYLNATRTEAIQFVSVDIYRHSFIFKTFDSTRLPLATWALRMQQTALKPYHAPLLFYTTVKSLIIPSAHVLACFRLLRKACDLKVNSTIYHRQTRCLYPWWQLLLAYLAGVFCVYLHCSTSSWLPSTAVSLTPCEVKC